MQGFEPVKTWDRVGGPAPYEIDLGERLVAFFEKAATGGAPIDVRGLTPQGAGPTLGRELETVALLHSLADGGPVLEVGCGSGRIARPLAATGLRVDGIDFAAAQVDKLRSMPGGDRVSASVADMTDFVLDERYRLVYCVFNSINNVLSQDGQVSVFERVAEHLTDDGVFVLEAGGNEWIEWLTNGQYAVTEQLQVKTAHLDLVRIDRTRQLLFEQHIELSADGITMGPGMHRYTYPSEYDLMARIAGLRLRDRWGGWSREAYTARSETVVSVFERAS